MSTLTKSDLELLDRIKRNLDQKVFHKDLVIITIGDYHNLISLSFYLDRLYVNLSCHIERNYHIKAKGMLESYTTTRSPVAHLYQKCIKFVK